MYIHILLAILYVSNKLFKLVQTNLKILCYRFTLFEIIMMKMCCTRCDSGSAVNSKLFTVQNKFVNHPRYLFVQPLNILCLKSITNT